MNILEEIIEAKRKEVAGRLTMMPVSALQHQSEDLPAPRPFSTVFQGGGIHVIAEVKRESPSAGFIRFPFEPADIAKAYKEGGAGAISVLMDEAYFGGGEDQFREVRAAVDLPLLYKEFVIDDWQIWHARTLGASAVLLIASVLSDDEISTFMNVAAEAGVDILLEVHDREELDRALSLNASLIGINNRDLKTFKTSIETTLNLAEHVPDSVTLISESGIRSPEDLEKLSAVGVKGVLVGEHFLRQPDIIEAVRTLCSV